MYKSRKYLKKKIENKDFKIHSNVNDLTQCSSEVDTFDTGDNIKNIRVHGITIEKQNINTDNIKSNLSWF
jgi:ribosomal protein L9